MGNSNVIYMFDKNKRQFFEDEKILPGAYKVMRLILDKDEKMFNFICIQLDLRFSFFPLVWIVYHDISNCDLDLTIEYLKEWSYSKITDLNDYIKLYSPGERHI